MITGLMKKSEVHRNESDRRRTSTRLAQSTDARAIAEINVRAWQKAYKGLLPDALLDKLSVDGAAKGWQAHIESGVIIWLLEFDGVVRGFASIGKSLDKDAEQDVAELFTIYIEPEYVGMHLGSELIHAALNDLRHSQFRQCTVWFLAGNDQAQAFYERIGFIKDNVEKHEMLNGIEMHQIRYRLQLEGLRLESLN